MLAVLDTSSTAYHSGQIVGIVAVALITIYFVVRARSRAAVVLTILIGAAILTADATNFLAHGSGGPWSTPKGKGLKAGFLDGCGRDSPAPVCKCMFDHISSRPPYDTPDGFVTLSEGISSYMRTGAPNRVTHVLVDAAQRCRASA